MPEDEQAEALARIAEQLERLPQRMAAAMGKEPRRPSPLDPDYLMRALGMDPDKARERRRFGAEMRNLRQTRITSIVALVIAGASALGTLAIAATQIF